MAEESSGENHLVEYYGTECVHCQEMAPLIEQLEAETGVLDHVACAEVWDRHDFGHTHEPDSR